MSEISYSMANELKEAIKRDDLQEFNSFLSNNPRFLDDDDALRTWPQDPLLLACQHSSFKIAGEILARKPEFASKKYDNGWTAMHVASAKGDVRIVDVLERANPQLRLEVDNFSRTPLHIGAVNGHECVVEDLADRESLPRTTSQEETALHLALKNHHVGVFQVLVKKVKEFNLEILLGCKDIEGDLLLHIAVRNCLPETVKLLLVDSTYSGMVKVNAKNDSGFTAFDILDVLREDGKEDMEIEKILRRAGALRARELTGNKVGSNLLIEQKLDSRKHEVLIEFDDHWNGNLGSKRSESLMSRYFAALIAATLLAAMTFHAALRPPAALRQDFPSINATMVVVQDGVINRQFVLFNSIAFFTALAFITILTHELPIKPWLHISVFSAIGAYMCSITFISPQEVVTVLIIGSSIMLTALFRCLALHKRVLNNLQWMCARIHLI